MFQTNFHSTYNLYNLQELDCRVLDCSMLADAGSNILAKRHTLPYITHYNQFTARGGRQWTRKVPGAAALCSAACLLSTCLLLAGTASNTPPPPTLIKLQW